MTEAEWLAERKKGIGGSDAAAALGVSPYRTPYELWVDKTTTGQIEPDAAKAARYRWAHLMEQPIAKVLAEDTGRHVPLALPYYTKRHSSVPWMFCTPDAWQYEKSRPERGIVQIKDVSEYNVGAWADGPPLHVQVQIQHEMACTQTAWGTIAALIGKSDFRWYDVERDDSFIEAMMAGEVKFWQRVVDDDPPPAEGMTPETYAKVLKQLHPQDSGETITLPPEAADWDRRLLHLNTQIKELDDLKKSLENQLKESLGDATFGTLPTGGRYSWQTTERKGYTVKPTQQRTLRRLKK